MAHRLSTIEGRAIYGKRKSTVEPVFGIIKSVMGFRQFHLRGLDDVSGEWTLVDYGLESQADLQPLSAVIPDHRSTAQIPFSVEKTSFGVPAMVRQRPTTVDFGIHPPNRLRSVRSHALRCSAAIAKSDGLLAVRPAILE